MVVEYQKGTDYAKELEKLEKEGWMVIEGAPIEKITVQIIGRRFVLEKR